MKLLSTNKPDAVRSMQIRDTYEAKLDRDFGISDDVQRPMAAEALIGSADFRPCTEKEVWGFAIAAGTWFWFVGRTTRAGRVFMAKEEKHFYATKIERDAAALAYLDDAEARALRKNRSTK